MDNNISNEKNKFPKRNIILYLSIIVIIICVGFKTSYAFYTAVVTNSKNPSATVVRSGELEMKFTNNTKYLNVTNLTLMSASDAASDPNNYSSFSISNTGSVTGKYKLYLSNYTITENLVNQDFKWKLTVNGTVYSGTFYDLFNGKTVVSGVITSSSDDVLLVPNYITLAANGSHNCEFRVWIQEEEHIQINLTEGTFRTTLKLVAINQ